MLRLLLCLAVLLSGLLGCSPREAPPELRWRFLGGQFLKDQTNAPVLREVLNLPEAGPLAEPLAQLLARGWWRLATDNAEPTAEALANGAELMADLLQQRSTGEVMGGPDGREFALAVQVPSHRVGVWEKAWPAWIQAFHAARGGKPGNPSVIPHEGGLLAVSDAHLLPPDSIRQRLAAYSPDTDALFQLDMAIAQRPSTQVTFTTTNGNVRLAAVVTSLRTLPKTLPEWNLPSFIREPLIQFTALRGLNEITAGWLEAQPWTGGRWPEQVFIWGQPANDPTSIRFPFLAARMADPQAMIDQWYRRLAPQFAPVSPAPLYQGQILQETNPSRLIIVGGFPVTPVLQVTEQEEKPFVTFGVFPLIRSTNPLEPEMIARMSRTNVLLYDFEFTSEAIRQWNAFLQLPDLFEGRQGIMSYPGTRWLLAAGPRIGECVTEAVVTGEREIQVLRKSPVGLTGLELTALVRALDPTPPMRRVLIPTNHPTSKPN